jgi:hypothetical protein
VKVGRNEPCPCGSGKKYKQCCADKATARSTLLSQGLLALLGLAFILVVISIVDGLYSSDRGGAAPNRVWSPEHGHWHDLGGRKVP